MSLELTHNIKRYGFELNVSVGKESGFSFLFTPPIQTSGLIRLENWIDIKIYNISSVHHFRKAVEKALKGKSSKYVQRFCEETGDIPCIDRNKHHKEEHTIQIRQTISFSKDRDLSKKRDLWIVMEVNHVNHFYHRTERNWKMSLRATELLSILAAMIKFFSL